jgi:hypothetical protein
MRALPLGNGAILAPPTDPNIGYPPGNPGAVTLVEGFPYAIRSAALVASHLTLQFAEYEVWTQWCALQTSYPDPIPGSCTASGCDAGSPSPTIAIRLLPLVHRPPE